MEAVHVASVMQAGITLATSVQMKNIIDEMEFQVDYFKKINKAVPRFDDKVGYKIKTKNEIDTLQVNLTRRCNLSCKHCHLSCNLNRSEDMSMDVADKVIDL